MSDYDVGSAFSEMEDDLIGSMMRNLKRHKAEELKEGYNWTQWQTLQLKALEEYRQNNQKVFSDKFQKTNSKIQAGIINAYQQGGTEQEIKILKSIQNGFTGYHYTGNTKITGEFFRTNDRKMNALIQATTNDLQKAETATLRMTNDKYRKIIFNAQVYANSGAGTYEKAVDMATSDFLAAGINSVKYKGGRQVNIKSYAEMAVQTASKRAYLTGEGNKRKEWGVSLVIVQPRGGGCPLCLPFIGKILIDDVWSGGSQSDGDYDLMSDAISAGLYHPNCRDTHTTYFPELDEEPEDADEQDRDNAVEAYKRQQQQNYTENQSDKYSRLEKYSLDESNRQKYRRKAAEWQNKAESLNDSKVSQPKEKMLTMSQNEQQELQKLKDEIVNQTLQKSENNGIIKNNKKVVKTSATDFSELGKFKQKLNIDERMNKEYYSTIKEKFSHGSDDAKTLFNKFVPKNSVENASFEDTARYDPKTKKISMHYGADLHNRRGAGATWFHEHGHMIDDMAGKLSENDEFYKLLRSDKNDYIGRIIKSQEKPNLKGAYAALEKELQNFRSQSGVSDMFNGISAGKIKGCAIHETGYWCISSVCHESFAHMYEAQFDSVRYEQMKKYFPKSLECFEKIMKEAIK